jgi:branched-subunit amino acid transport protein
MNLWLTMLLAGAATFAIRVSFIGAAGRIDAPAWFRRMLRFVPIAALTALVWPDLLIAGGQISLGEPRLVAGVIAALVAWKARSVSLTIGIGMLALWVIQWLR